MDGPAVCADMLWLFQQAAFSRCCAAGNFKVGHTPWKAVDAVDLPDEPAVTRICSGVCFVGRTAGARARRQRMPSWGISALC